MLKAIAQRPPFAATTAFAVAGAAAYLTGNPFAVFFSVFLGAGAIVSLICALAWQLGWKRLAGALFLVFGALMFLTGLMAFAPQPVLVAYALLALGASTLAESRAR